MSAQPTETATATFERITDGSEADPWAGLGADIEKVFASTQSPDSTPPADTPTGEPPATDAPVTEPPAEPPAEPAAEPTTTEDTAPTVPAPESKLAPLFAIPHNDPQAIDKAAQILADFKGYNEIAFWNLANGLYETIKPTIQQHALKQLGPDGALKALGVPEDKAAAIKSYLEGNESALPVERDFDPFPEPDVNGDVTYWNGRAYVTRNVEDREGLEFEAYLAAKDRYELAVEKQRTATATKRAEAEARAKQEREAQEREAKLIDDRERDWFTGGIDAVKELMDKADLSFAPENSFEERSLMATVAWTLEHDKTLNELTESARPHVHRGTGNVADFKQQRDRRTREIVAETITEFSKRFVQQQKALAATVATEPKYPPGTKTVEVEDQRPQSSNQRPQTWEEVQANMQAGIERALSR